VPVIASVRTWEALPSGTGAVRLFRLFFILISFTKSHSTKIQQNKLNFFFSQRKKNFSNLGFVFGSQLLWQNFNLHLKSEKGWRDPTKDPYTFCKVSLQK
jgi:hypothetical protein